MLSVHKSINYRKSLIVLGLATLGLFLAPNSAKAFTLVDRTSFTDNDFRDLMTQKQFTELFVAESRIGDNRSSSGNHEIDILQNTEISFTPVKKGDRVWKSGELVDFSLEYTGSDVIYTVGAQTLTTNFFTSPVTDIFLRTFAQKDRTSNYNNILNLSNLLFYEQGSNEGKTIGSGSLSSSGTASSSDTDYIQLTNISAGFKLTGKTSFSWTGTAPTNSNLAYQIKVGSSPKKKKVPEPGTVGAIFLAGIAAVSSLKRNKEVQP